MESKVIGTEVKLYLATEDYLSMPAGTAESIVVTMYQYSYSYGENLHIAFLLEGLKDFEEVHTYLIGINRGKVYNIESKGEDCNLRLKRCRVNQFSNTSLEGVAEQLIVNK